MCEPVTIITAVAAAVATYTQYQAAKAQKKAAQYNQKIAYQRALDARERGNVAESQYRTRIGMLVGRQRAQIGASGAAVGEGVTARIIEDTEATGELDALTIRNNAEREAWGFESQAGGFGFEVGMAEIQGTVGTASTGLAGAAQSYGAYKTYGGKKKETN